MSSGINSKEVEKAWEAALMSEFCPPRDRGGETEWVSGTLEGLQAQNIHHPPPQHPPSAIWLGLEGFPISKSNLLKPKYSWQGITC